MMAQRPLVSVIVPVYNASDYLAATLRSFEGQSYGNVEWVLVDDGSTDGSAQVCAEWCAADPLHRRLFRKQNGGASSARNTGLEHAVGAYVLFWDSDDTQSSLAIEKLVECSHGFDSVSVCAIRRMLPDGRERDLFTCKRHESTPEEALDEWLRGGCLYGFVKRRGPLDFSITHRDARGRPLLRLGCPRALPTGLVRDRVPHDRVDDLHPLPCDGLERLVAPALRGG